MICNRVSRLCETAGTGYAVEGRRWHVRGEIPGVNASWMGSGDGGCLGMCLVRMSRDRFGGKESVGMHRVCPLPATRESGTEPQAPRRRLSSQSGDGVQTKGQDIEQFVSHRRYPWSHQTRTSKMQPMLD